jgi:hypothetical protein
MSSALRWIMAPQAKLLKCACSEKRLPDFHDTPENHRPPSVLTLPFSDHLRCLDLARSFLAAPASQGPQIRCRISGGPIHRDPSSKPAGSAFSNYDLAFMRSLKTIAYFPINLPRRDKVHSILCDCRNNSRNRQNHGLRIPVFLFKMARQQELLCLLWSRTKTKAAKPSRIGPAFKK